MSGTGIFICGVGSRETEGCNLPARALVTSNSFKFSHLRQLPNLYFAYTFMAKTNTETNTSRGINRCVTSSKSSNTFGNSCNFVLLFIQEQGESRQTTKRECPELEAFSKYWEQRRESLFFGYKGSIYQLWT